MHACAQSNGGLNPFAVRLDAATGTVVWSSQTVYSSFARSMRLACSSVAQECYMTVFSSLTKSLAIWAINYRTCASSYEQCTLAPTDGTSRTPPTRMVELTPHRNGRDPVDRQHCEQPEPAHEQRQCDPCDRCAGREARRLHRLHRPRHGLAVQLDHLQRHAVRRPAFRAAPPYPHTISQGAPPPPPPAPDCALSLVCRSTGAVSGTFTTYVGSVSGTNTNYLQTMELLADASSDLYLVSRVPYGINGPTTSAGLHLRKYVS